MLSKFEMDVAKGRAVWPEMAMKELEAGSRLDYALATWDIKSGAQAMADWHDARIAMAVWVQCYGGAPRC